MTPEFIRAEIQWRTEGPAPSRDPRPGWIRRFVSWLWDPWAFGGVLLLLALLVAFRTSGLETEGMLTFFHAVFLAGFLFGLARAYWGPR